MRKSELTSDRLRDAEVRVKKAFNVAFECATKCPQEFSQEAFTSIFHMMLTLSEPKDVKK